MLKSTLYKNRLTQEDRRFRYYLTLGVGVFVLVSSVVPFLHVEEKSRQEQEKLPLQLTAFILKKKVEPKISIPPISTPKIETPKIIEQVKEVVNKNEKPKERVKKVVKKVVKKKVKVNNRVKDTPQKSVVVAKIPKVKSTDIERSAARTQAKKSGVLALQSGLSQLTSRQVKTSSAPVIRGLNASGQQQSHSQIMAVSQGRSGARAAQQVKGDIIATVSTQHTTDVIAQAQAGAILADADASPQHSLNTDAQVLGIRDESDIRQIFEKNKSTIYSIYARAQRKNEDLAGKLVLEINITPEGRVAGVELINSELQDAKLVKKIMTRIRMFKFGEQNVASLTMRYTFDFVAS